MKIVVLSDLHYHVEPWSDDCYWSVADILLERVVRRINRKRETDLVLVLGDLLADGHESGAPDLLAHLKGILDGLSCPYLAIAGNHDNAESFAKVFGALPDFFDVAGVRFVPFVDPEEPNWNARRTERDMARLQAARNGHCGPIVCLQHTSLFPPHSCECPFNFVNAEEVIERMRQARVSLSLSGHFHQGVARIESDGIVFSICPALCETPFEYLEISVENEKIAIQRRSLSVPREHRLHDMHVHTPLAYCSENMDFDLAVSLGEAFGLAGLAFCEHTGQLYFDAQTFWGAGFMERGIETDSARECRMEAYLKALDSLANDAVVRGMEIDTDFSGRLVVRPEHAARVQFTLGTIHWLPELQREEPRFDVARQEFLFMLDRVCASGVDALAHPLRVFRRFGPEAQESLIDQTVSVLSRHRVAAELNFHLNEPSERFVLACLNSGVPLTLGSDAHNLAKVGELAPHLELLERCGCRGDLTRVLLDVEALENRQAKRVFLRS